MSCILDDCLKGCYLTYSLTSCNTKTFRPIKRTALTKKKTGMISSDGFLEFIILYNALCTMHAGEIMHCKSCYNCLRSVEQVMP